MSLVSFLCFLVMLLSSCVDFVTPSYSLPLPYLTSSFNDSTLTRSLKAIEQILGALEFVLHCFSSVRTQLHASFISFSFLEMA